MYGGSGQLGLLNELWFFYPSRNEWKRKTFSGVPRTHVSRTV